MKKCEMSQRIFHGRQDVYAIGYEKSNGELGFHPACKNNRQHKKLKLKTFEQHFSGEELIGIYPLLPDNTVKFIVADFDDHAGGSEKKKLKPFSDSKAFRKAANKLGINCYIERSKSGKGYHVWIFFKDHLPASKARKLADKILSIAGISEKEDSSFCRFFPARDSVTEGKLGILLHYLFGARLGRKEILYFSIIKTNGSLSKSEVNFTSRPPLDKAELDRVIESINSRENQKIRQGNLSESTSAQNTLNNLLVSCLVNSF